MKKNTFILTTGLSGSSVVTGLINQAGFWCGDKTEYKNNGTGKYETYENSDFVALNNRLVELSGNIFHSKAWYEDQYRDSFTELYNKIDLTDFKQFSDDCLKHHPWVLKDPKLWMTLGFWLKLFNGQEFRVIILTRNINQLWVSQTNKRIIYDYQYLRCSEKKTQQQLMRFLEQNNIDYLVQEYDLLEEKTENELNRLNQFLKTEINSSDWNQIYNKKKKSFIPFLLEVKAILIYIKNYTTRIK